MKEKIENKIREQAYGFIKNNEDYVFDKKGGYSYYEYESSITCVTELSSLEEKELTTQGYNQLFEDTKEFCTDLLNDDGVSEFFNLNDDEIQYIEDNNLLQYFIDFANGVIEGLER